MGPGPYFTTTAYNTFIASTLGYIAQLVPLSADVTMAEQSGINGLLPGPGNWITLSDGFQLKESYGQAASFRSIQAVSMAAKALVLFGHDRQRLLEGDKKKEYGPGNINSLTDIRYMAANIRDWSGRDNMHPGRAQNWATWYKKSFVVSIADNSSHLQRALWRRSLVGLPAPGQGKFGKSKGNPSKEPLCRRSWRHLIPTRKSDDCIN